MRCYKRGSVALNLELVGYRAGEDFAELLGVFVDADQFREIAMESPHAEWCSGFDRYALIAPGQKRPTEVRETHRTQWMLPGRVDFHTWLAG